MTVRNGMETLISQMRSLIAESGTTIFSDDRLQTILDNNRYDFYQLPLRIVGQVVGGSTIYKWYSLPNVRYYEGTASGTALVRIFDFNGVVQSAYTSDPTTAQFVFTNDTRGSAYYMTGRSFNFNKAVSEAWKEKAAYHSGNFDFKVEGRSFNKSQVVKQCLEMANYYSAMADPVMHNIDRGDY